MDQNIDAAVFTSLAANVDLRQIDPQKNGSAMRSKIMTASRANILFHQSITS
jgi:hypothetical protein